MIYLTWNNFETRGEKPRPPRALELKYMHGGELISRPLSMTDNILMCSENWTELLRSDIRDRFVFSSCGLSEFNEVSFVCVSHPIC